MANDNNRTGNGCYLDDNPRIGRGRDAATGLPANESILFGHTSAEIAAGVAAPVGSFALCTDGQWYGKFGAGDTDWVAMYAPRSAWIDLTSDIATGWAADTVIFGAPEYRIVGDRVEVRGGVVSPVGEQVHPSTIFNNFPNGAYGLTPPNAIWSSQTYLSGGPPAPYTGYVAISSTQNFTQNGAGSGTVSSKYVNLGGISWSLTS